MSDSPIRFFGLSESPFSKEIPDSELWLPPSKQELVDELCEAVHDRSQVLLVGEPGAGKTCVLRALRHRLPQAGFRLTYCHNATLGRRDFYRQLCQALGLTPAATAAAVFYAVSAHVENLGRERIHPVFLLDEAHLLHQDTLDHLHILLNYEWDSRALLSLVLVGLPDLQDRLELRKNRSLYSRIERRLSVGPMCRRARHSQCSGLVGTWRSSAIPPTRGGSCPSTGPVSENPVPARTAGRLHRPASRAVCAPSRRGPRTPHARCAPARPRTRTAPGRP